MAYVFAPVELEKDGKTTVPLNAVEDAELRYDGWLPTGTPPADHSNEYVRVGDIGDPTTPAGAALAAILSSIFRVAAPTGVAAIDTANIAAALSAAAAAGGGVVVLQGGIYVVNATLIIESGVILAGQGIYATTVQLTDGANVDLLQTKDFAALTGSGVAAGQELFGLFRLTLDGNRAHNASGWVARFYGKNHRTKEVRFINGASGGVWSEWASSSSGTQMEALWDDFRIANNAGTALNWLGPNDSMLSHGIVDKDASLPVGGYGVRVASPGGSNPVFDGVHVFGTYDYCWYLEAGALLDNCQGEGASIAQVMAGAQGVNITGGGYYGTRAATEEWGIQIGDATHTDVSGVTIDTFIYNLGAESYPIYMWSTGGQNRIKATVRCDRTSGSYVGGSPSVADLYEVVGGGSSVPNFIQHPTEVAFRGGASVAVDALQAFTVMDANGARYFWLDTTAGVAFFNNGASVYGFTGDHATPTFRLDANIGSLQPGSQAGLGSRLFSGSGAPTFGGTAGDFYFRLDTPTIETQRLYICTGGTSWTGIL